MVHVTQSEKKGRNQSKLKEKGYPVMQNPCKIIPEAFPDPFKSPQDVPKLFKKHPEDPRGTLDAPGRRLRSA